MLENYLIKSLRLETQTAVIFNYLKQMTSSLQTSQIKEWEKQLRLNCVDAISCACGIPIGSKAEISSSYYLIIFCLIINVSLCFFLSLGTWSRRKGDEWKKWWMNSGFLRLRKSSCATTPRQSCGDVKLILFVIRSAKR